MSVKLDEKEIDYLLSQYDIKIKGNENKQQKAELLIDNIAKIVCACVDNKFQESNHYDSAMRSCRTKHIVKNDLITHNIQCYDQGDMKGKYKPMLKIKRGGDELIGKHLKSIIPLNLQDLPEHIYYGYDFSGTEWFVKGLFELRGYKFDTQSIKKYITDNGGIVKNYNKKGYYTHGLVGNTTRGDQVTIAVNNNVDLMKMGTFVKRYLPELYNIF